jgi:hypothetical protein
MIVIGTESFIIGYFLMTFKVRNPVPPHFLILSANGRYKADSRGDAEPGVGQMSLKKYCQSFLKIRR